MLEKLRSYLIYNANQNNENSISNKYRGKRFVFLKEFCKNFDKPVSILDLGGSDYHWRHSMFSNNKDYHITIVNTEVQDVRDFRNVSFIKRDVQSLDFFGDKEYDMVYSNSLIEHINRSEKQMKLAEEICRIGKHYFIQTPNYYFPVEPHFLFPFFQFLPDARKAKLILKYKLGWFEKEDDENKAKEIAASIRLLKKKRTEKIISRSKYLFGKIFFIEQIIYCI